MSARGGPRQAGGVATRDPEAVERFAGILADWLASYTLPARLAAEMADGLEAGSAWVGAIGASAVRRAGWSDAESVAWGICVSALAAAHEAAAWSLDGGTRGRDPGGANGPARSLLAADGLIAAAHETLASLPPERLVAAVAALQETYGGGGPWLVLSTGGPSAGDPPAWTRLVAVALIPAATERPDGPWGDLAAAWGRRSGAGRGGIGPDRDGERDRAVPDRSLFEHPAADPSTIALLRAAAEAARRPGRKDSRAQT